MHGFLLAHYFHCVLNEHECMHLVIHVMSFVKYFPTDISIAVIDLLQEMTDVDTLNESEEGATALIDALVSFFSYRLQEDKGLTLLGNFW